MECKFEIICKFLKLLLHVYIDSYAVCMFPNSAKFDASKEICLQVNAEEE
jgi:hypothetical protein